MNILDKLQAILIGKGVILPISKGTIPDKPDNVIALFEYGAAPPIHTFRKINDVFNVQLRVRNKSPTEAYQIAKDISGKLNHYNDTEINILQISTVLDIGKDTHNPQRHEYTSNFKITATG